MDTTTLATFRIDKKTWKKFKKWAADKDSNASKELNQFIKRALGLIDENIDTNLDNNLEQRIETYLEDNLDNRIEQTVTNYLDKNLDSYIDKNIDQELPKAESLQEESNEQLTNAELARRMNVSPATVSRWANQKRQPPLDLEWRYDLSLRKWVK